MNSPKQVCKSYTLPGSNGYNLVLSETVGRGEIEVSIQRLAGGKENRLEVATVRINAEQFGLLCRMDSSYSGLEVFDAVDAEFPEVREPIALLDEDQPTDPPF